MKRLTIGLLAAVPLCVTPFASAAQETIHPTYLIRQEFVKPAEMDAYETETIRWLDDLAESAAAEDLQWVSVYGPELGYSYIIPIQGLAGFDRARSIIGMTRADAHARWAKSDGPTPVEHVEQSVIELRPELSYLPRTVALNLDLPFRKYHWYHVIPGLEADFEGIATQIVDLFGGAGIEHGYRIYAYVIGADMPLYVMVERASDEADYASRTARIRETVGDRADALFGRLLQFARRVDVMEGSVRGELSFPAMGEGPPVP
ncbi:MAG: hypothetical protein OEU54_11970 [Gemmatimonadota bacterium]|nr:hypothetical protein [Gemmatimonadota bacterium]